ncbi:PTS sugar transporter subunit IIA [Paraliobacillus salinarum]|uniref:PTS sugar transporter subunit IIA n=1 Tax=Paraliobacillus salinarum TaxID=1158996 RepID=UPI0015F57541|nr:PTS sugar transporter subunit IIA [Paraliobacillus salinarum]
MLKELLPKENLANHNKVDSWEEAIRLASQPLLKQGAIEEQYITNMIDSVNVNGPYIVLNDYFALPHAKAGEAVNKQGMALLTLDHPVDLKGNPVKLFLVLAAIDSTSHLKALSEISELLMDDEKYKVFINGNVDDIYKLINGEVN